MKKDVTKIDTKRKRKLSLWRLIIAFLIISSLAYGTTLNVSKWRQEKIESKIPVVKPWFAAYVDATATPLYAFEQVEATVTSEIILSFIVSSSEMPCKPSWGNYYTMEQASVAIDLDRRIARLEQQGGGVAISFGGALNNELALKCTDPDKLLDAYNSVIERYNVDTIDLDLENESLSNVKALKRRAMVFAKLQKQYRSNNKNLAIWLTLPVAPQGLTEEGTSAVAEMLSNGVDLAGVNIMIMDYGLSRQEDQTMFEASKQALIETHRQLGILYKNAGISLSDSSVWKKIGATPMIGQNDIVNEVFSLEDAKKLNLLALSQNIGRMSMWSANRDIPCGENYVDTKVVSDSCSGVESPKLSFSKTLSNGFDGKFKQNAGILTISDHKNNSIVVDDPEKSPYQIWKKTGAYPKETKVVWHRNVYEAKWWTKNELPDNPVLQSWQTPWRLIGPVLEGERPIKQATLPSGTYPKWSGKTIYNDGDRVLFEGTPFQAKWWNNGESPAASVANPDSSPWTPLTQSQIVNILKNIKN